MENKETLGKRIAMLRKEKGYTQEQLAEKVGVSAQAVSKWENDVSCPDITLLPLLADILGVTVDELLGVNTRSFTTRAQEQATRFLSLHFPVQN